MAFPFLVTKLAYDPTFALALLLEKCVFFMFEPFEILQLYFFSFVIVVAQQANKLGSQLERGEDGNKKGKRLHKAHTSGSVYRG